MWTYYNINKLKSLTLLSFHPFFVVVVSAEKIFNEYPLRLRH
jgi:hypothetical protein